MLVSVRQKAILKTAKFAEVSWNTLVMAKNLPALTVGKKK